MGKEMKIKSIKRVVLDTPKQFYDVVESLPNHNFVIATTSGGVVSHNCSFEDEINFASMTTDVEKIKAKQKHLISQVDARMQSRFMKGTKLPTLNIIASSKTSDQSFLDGYINTKKKNESKTTLIIDEPQWVVRNDKDSPIKFYVAVGNKFLASEVLPRDASETVIDSYRSKGYQMMKVPIGYWEAFNDNVELALTDIAGISTTSALKYISGVRLNEIKLDGYENPFSREVLEVGTGDDLQYSQFFDTSKVSNLLKSKPLYIHLDMSKSGDRTGIAGVWIMGKRLGHGNDKQSREAYYKVAFSVAIKAPKGFEVSFEKNRTFVRWLRSQGFNIKGVTMDTYQSAQIKQQLIADGFKADILSVDRLSNIDGTRTKACLPYVNFKSIIYEKRLELYRKCDLLTDEIIGLEKEPDGHIEHSEGGTQGCFTGDTKVRLVDGRSLTFFQLVEEYERGKQNYVYSVNIERECIEARPIKKVWLTLHDQPLVRVTLDNGEQIKCTPNHLFMLRNGSYVEARDLIAGDSLMPLYTKVATAGLRGYRLCFNPFEEKWHYEHRQFAVAVDDVRYLVHHLDCNPLNNNPDNLIWCSRARHQQLHAEISTGAHSAAAEQKRSQSLSAYYKNNRDNPVFLERNKKIKRAALLRSGDPQRIETGMSKKELQQLNGQRLRQEAAARKKAKQDRITAIETKYNVTWDTLSHQERDKYGLLYTRAMHPEIEERIAEKVSENHAAGKYEKAHQALQWCNEQRKLLKQLFPVVDPDRFFELFGIDYESLPARQRGVWNNRYREKLYSLTNHKVVKVEWLNETSDVYDLEVDETHNFALDAGVFVHNSKDICDALCGSLYSASQHLEEYAFDYGESIDDTLRVNTFNTSREQVQNQINVAFEQELQDLLTPKSIKEQMKKDKEANDTYQYNSPAYVSQGMLIW